MEDGRAGLRIASFNLENFPGEAGTRRSERCAVLRPQLDRLKADVLCLQEVDSEKAGSPAKRTIEALHQLLAETSYSPFHCVCTSAEKPGVPRDKHNLVILSRWPIACSAQYANDLVAPPRYRMVTAEPPSAAEEAVHWDRPILRADIQLPGGPLLHVLNLHLRAPLAAFIAGQKLAPFAWRTVPGWAEGYYLASMKRAGQALETRLVVDRIFDRHPEALIAVCGDFNAEEREAPTRILIGDTEDTGNGQLLSRELVALEHTLPEHRRFTVIHAGRRQMLDHLLVSRPLLSRFRDMDVQNEGLGDEVVAYTRVDRTLESYHAPIVAAFEMPRSRE
jgi:endonuclease/exonuclease/phosphatase family metal-dependent hydrolase